MSQARTIGNRFGFQRRFVIGETFDILVQVDSVFVVCIFRNGIPGTGFAATPEEGHPCRQLARIRARPSSALSRARLSFQFGLRRRLFTGETFVSGLVDYHSFTRWRIRDPPRLRHGRFRLENAGVSRSRPQAEKFATSWTSFPPCSSSATLRTS